MTITRTAQRMKGAWNARASSDPFFYVETANWDGDVGRLFLLGEERAELLIDPMLRAHAIEPAGKIVLDLGCGVGRFARPLSKRFEKYIGVDVSEAMIEKSSGLHRGQDGNISFLASDIATACSACHGSPAH